MVFSVNSVVKSIRIENNDKGELTFLKDKIVT